MNCFGRNLARCCDIELMGYGFKKKSGGLYVRVVNDVVQTFKIEKLQSGRVCRGLFSVLPLCLRLDTGRALGIAYSRELHKFEITPGLQMVGGWEFDLQSEESINACIVEIVRFIKCYLVPLFERANCCQTGLAEIVALDKLFDENRIASLQQLGVKDLAVPDAGFNLLDRSKYYMAIKNGDYDYANECQTALLNQNINAFEKRQHYDFLTPEKLDADRLEIQMLKDELKRIEARDVEYFRQLIDENEAYSRETLKDYL